MSWKVIQGDVLNVLKTLDAESFDFVLSDVPYGLGGHEPTPAEVLAFLQGAALNTGDFMGSKWSIPSVETWSEVRRVAKPGAHCFSFAGTRTWDLVSMGLRMAGWTNRDTVAMDHPALRMVSAQGMAKGQRVGKAIDKAKGAKREVIATVKKTPSAGGANTNEGWVRPWAEGKTTMDITAPATPEAAEGYGSCLAPTWEPVLVFRKPFAGSLAANVLRHGCGALNIGECRTGTTKDVPTSPRKTNNGLFKSLDHADGTTSGFDPNVGRWPKNAALVHASGCGAECIDGCPVKLLDEQSGVSTSGSRKSGEYENMGFGGNGKKPMRVVDGDTGTASRFFPTFRPDPPEPFLFAPKASRQEREIGCHELPGKTRQEVNGRDENSTGQHNGMAGIRRKGAIRNTGKCVKPQAFLRWLVRLGCRPGGRVLVPYCGSGSEMIACVCAGMDVVGIENDPEMIPIANARIKWWAEHPELSEEAKEHAIAEAKGQRRLFE